MNICIVVRAMPWHRLGGLEFHALDLATGLAELGCEVTVITTPPIEGEAPPPNNGVRVIPVEGVAPGDYSIGFFRRLNKAVSAAHKMFNFDVIHGQELAGLFLVPPAGVPLIITVHGTMFSETPLDRRSRAYLTWRQIMAAAWRATPRFLLYPAFKKMLTRADRLVVDSEFTYREVAGIDWRVKPKIQMVPLGIDGRRYPAPLGVGKPGDILKVALLGRVQESKGLRVVLAAAVKLRKRGVPVLFNVGGTGDYLDQLRDQVARQNLQEMVILHGRVDPAQVPAFMAGNNLFLFPDLTQPAFGLVAVEAMRYGLPVVGATNGAIPETVTAEVGWLYSAWDVQELTGLLVRLAGAPHEVAAKGAAALEQWKSWTAAKMATGTLTVYQEVKRED